MKRIARELENDHNRAYIYISSRCSDWQANSDYKLVERYLSLRCIEQIKSNEPAIGKSSKLSPERSKEKAVAEESDEKIKVFRLAPLTHDQMRSFVEAQGITPASNFVDAIIRADLERFAGRPQDLLDLIVYWRNSGRFGSYTEMVAYNIEKKLSEPNPDRDEQCPLSAVRAREGVELISAAMTFMRRNSVVLPDAPIDPNRSAQAIEAKAVLSDWGAKEINTLLTRAIFDVATYGTVRIHERRIREYLTAEWLFHLLNSGKNRHSIENLIFSNRYGIDLVIPSMQPIAAWLALKDDRIRQKLLDTAPEVLIGYGDPSQLPLSIRRQLLVSFANALEQRKSMDESFDIAAIRKLADQQLADTITELLKRSRKNSKNVQLLLRMIWQGEITACADIALSFALDPEIEISTRRYALLAICTVGNDIHKRNLVKSAISGIDIWNAELIADVYGNLFPEYVSIDVLLNFIKKLTPPKRYSVSGLNLALKQIVEERCPANLCLPLLRGLLTLLERGPCENKLFFKISERYKWLFPHATTLAQRIVNLDHAAWQDATVLHMIELVFMGSRYDVSVNSHARQFQETIEFQSDLRHLFFWRAINRERVEQAKKGKRLIDSWSVYISAHWTIRLEDFEYFVGQITDLRDLDDRLVALSTAFYLWKDLGKTRQGHTQLKKAVKGVPALEEALRGHMNPSAVSDDIRKHRRSMRDMERRQRIKLQKEEQDRKDWIDRLQRNPERLRHVEKSTVDTVFSDLFLLSEEISKPKEGTAKIGSGDWQSLIPEFGPEVAVAARDGLMAYWRLYTPILKSEKDTNAIPYGRIVGMTGLTIESEVRPEWARCLSNDEACIAARYMTLELNGFPPWAQKFLVSQPEACDEIMHRELIWEFDRPPQASAPYHVLHDLKYDVEELRIHYCPFILHLLEDRDPGPAETLETGLSILLQWQELDRTGFAELARQRCECASDDKRFLTWLVAWMYIDAKRAITCLQHWLSNADGSDEADRRMLSFCAALTDRRNLRFGSIFRDYERIEILRELVPLVYKHVRIEDDAHHEGVFHPGVRDDAQTTRSYLLEKIYDNPGRASFDTLMEFSRTLPHKRSRERMAQLARRRAADDAEKEPWQCSDVVSFAMDAEKLPRSARELFDLACGRLDDAKLELEDGRYSQAGILLKENFEPKLRNWFADTLQLRSHGKYSVSTEDEYADATRPDLNIHAPTAETPTVVELKIADNWPVPKLYERLENQLVGQYLRDARAQYGIYLLVWQGSWKRKTDAAKLTFEKLILELQKKADEIVRNRNDIDEIKVIGIDLTKREKKTANPAIR